MFDEEDLKTIYVVFFIIRELITNLKRFKKTEENKIKIFSFDHIFDIRSIIKSFQSKKISFQELLDQICFNDLQELYIFLNYSTFTPKHIYSDKHSQNNEFLKIFIRKNKTKNEFKNREFDKIKNEELIVKGFKKARFNSNKFCKNKKIAQKYKCIKKSIMKIIKKEIKKSSEVELSLIQTLSGKTKLIEHKCLKLIRINKEMHQTLLNNNKILNIDNQVDLETINSSMRKIYEKSYVPANFLPLFKCTELYAQFKEELFNMKFIQEAVDSIISSDYKVQIWFKKPALICDLNDKDKFPWSIFEKTNNIAIFNSFDSVLDLKKKD
jgi:hypothetical protein